MRIAQFIDFKRSGDRQQRLTKSDKFGRSKGEGDIATGAKGDKGKGVALSGGEAGVGVCGSAVLQGGG